MSSTCLLACGVALISGVAFAQPLFSRTQDPQAGARVFDAKGCIKCHAVRGIGGKVGPDLGRALRPRTFYDLAAALWNHAPKMADRMRQLGIVRPKLDAIESADLAAYLFTLNYFEPPGRAQTGRRLFTEKRCVVCHKIGSTGGAIGPPLDRLTWAASPIALAAAMWNHGAQMAEVMERRKSPDRPSWGRSWPI